MNRYQVLLPLLLALLTNALGCAPVAPLLAPTFQTISPNEQVTQKAILSALAAHEWRVTKDARGQIEAVHSNKDATATIAIHYRGTRISIKLLSSSNLLHGRSAAGQEIIHEDYNRWMQLLEHDIQVNIGKSF